jgi:hypothetical protein
MKKATVLIFGILFVVAGRANGQATDFAWNVPTSTDPYNPFSKDHSGSRQVIGPYDLDGDGKMELLVQDYTWGGRVHVLENAGVDTWELVYSSPPLDSTNTTGNIRAIGAGDADGDGKGEFYFLSGCKSTATGCPAFYNPAYPEGLYVFEYTGTDNDYGTAPASIYQFVDPPDRWRAEQLEVTDVDKDGYDEIMFGNNGSNGLYDAWYILGVEGDIGSGFETWVEEAHWTSRGSYDVDPVDRGGGSPYGIVAANLNGNSKNEIVMGSWNNLNVTLARSTGPNTYEAPGAADADFWVHLAPGDYVSLFGLTVVDVDGDGNDEVYGSVYETGNVYVLDYSPGNDVTKIRAQNYAYDVIPGLSSLGLTAGDLDGDGHMDFIGTGTTYEASEYQQDLAPNWIDIVEYNGGDPKDPASYSDVINVLFPEDIKDSFDHVMRDSAGVMTEYYESGDQGGEFVSKLAFLGDVDNDGWNEVAMGFQGVDDSTYTFTETFNPADSTYTRELVSAQVNPNRVFMRVLAHDGATKIEIQDDRVVLPSDYVLEQNYPNPFNPETTIRFTLPIDKTISVRVYDVSGRLVKAVVDNQFYSQGTYEVSWDGTNAAGSKVASGTYLYTLQYGNYRQTKTMVLLK